MSDPYSALDVPRCTECDAALTWQLDPTHAGLCAPCDRRLTRAAFRRHIDAAAARHALDVHQRYIAQLVGLPYIDAGTLDDTLAPLGEGLSDHRAAGTPDPFGSVPVLSPRNLGAHRARGTAPAAGGAL